MLEGEHVVNSQPLLQIAFWCIGEFGDLLVNPQELEGSPSHTYASNGRQVDENEVVEVFERLMPRNAMTITTREYGLTALAKLVTRFESCAEKIRALIRHYSAHMNLELQQRSVEYTHILLKDDMKFGLLERMPTISHNALNSAAPVVDSIEQQPTSSAVPQANDLLFSTTDDVAADHLLSNPSATTVMGSSGGDLLDLIGLNNGTGSTQPKPSGTTQGELFDLADLMGG